MGISRLVYGRSAMQGLYLNPDAWYEERRITAWLNTRALRIDRAGAPVALGTGETLTYDRLILATGSSSHVPPIEGFGVPGTFVLRSAEDAIGLRAFAQRPATPPRGRRRRRPARPRGGVRAAQARPPDGRARALQPLLRRQLDARAAKILRDYLEGLGHGVRDGGRGRARRRQRAPARRDAERRPPPGGAHPARGRRASGRTSTLAREAGLTVKRGVLVDDRMRTDDPQILAAGDVAEFGGQLPGLWPTAVAQAEVAADTVARRRQDLRRHRSRSRSSRSSASS